jgi:DNA-binding NarL/FixJ family response regulator
MAGTKMRDEIRIVIANDHTLFREMLCQVLRQARGIKVVGEAGNGKRALEVIKDLKPDLVLLDGKMPEMDSIEVLLAIREQNLKTKALMLSANRDEDKIFKCLKDGAKGCLSKDVSIADLVKAIHAIHKGELWVERKLIAKFFEGEAASYSGGENPADEPKKVLTPREKEVLSILATGCTNKEIAKVLFISEKTVKSHLDSIFKKLNVSRRLQAILYAINRGLT